MYKQIRESNYEISDNGIIRNIKTKEKLKYSVNHRGYYKINLDIGEGKRHYFVHRLVAETFIPKIDGKDYVNHKNIKGTNNLENKRDNRVENLEWCTTEENTDYAFYHSENMSQRKPVVSIDINTHEIQEYKSIYQAAKHLIKEDVTEQKIKRFSHNIKKCCDGEAKICQGRYWRYKTQYNLETLEEFIYNVEHKYTPEQELIIKLNRISADSIKRRMKVYSMSLDEAIKYKKGEHCIKHIPHNKGKVNNNSKCQQGLNQKFGKLTVIDIIREANKKPKYRCLCDCGNEIITQYTNVLIGKTKSCSKCR